MGEHTPVLREAIAAFLGDLELQGRASTAVTYRSDLRHLLASGTDALAQITEADCRAILIDRRRAGMADATLAKMLGALSSFFKWCIEKGYRVDNPTRGIPAPRVRARQKRWLDMDVLRRLDAACADDTDRAILLLLSGLGLRCAEAVGVRWDDVRWDDGSLRLLGKGRKVRTVALAPVELAILGRLRGRDARYVLPFRSTRTLYKRVSKMGLRAGVGHVWPHLLRHSFACNFLLASDDAASLQVLLGHSSPVMTALYTQSVRSESALSQQRRVGLGARIFADSSGSDANPLGAEGAARDERCCLHPPLAQAARLVPKRGDPMVAARRQVEF